MKRTDLDKSAGPLPRLREDVVVVLVYDGVKLLDVAGPVDVFTEANQFGAHYRVRLVSVSGGPVTTSSGVRLAVDGAASDAPHSHTFLVAGSDVHPRASVPAELSSATFQVASTARRVASICTGAFLLAEAGLLDGKRATTHWKVAQILATQYPHITVEPDAIYVRDGSTYTSAGVSAGVDLALALVEDDHGPAMARDIARALVVYLQRSGGQSQFSAAVKGSPPRTPALRSIVNLVMADPTADHTLDHLAQRLNISSRHLTRLFREELDTTPGKFVEAARMNLARGYLDDGHPVSDAAALAGFPSYESFRRVFTRDLGISPGAYQRRFRTSHRTQDDAAS